MEQHYDLEVLKNVLYSGILCDVLDQKGYRNQSLSNAIAGLGEHTVIFGPAFTGFEIKTLLNPTMWI